MKQNPFKTLGRKTWKYLRIYKWWVFGLLNILVIVIASFGIGAAISLNILFSDDSLTNKQIESKFYPVVRTLRKITDAIYFPYYFSGSNLPTYHLKIAQPDLNFLLENLPPPYTDTPFTDEYKQEVPAVLVYDGTEYDVEVRFRGQNNSHWSADKKSWLVKTKNGEYIDGKSEFDLILPFDRQYVIQDLSLYQAKKLGLIAPESKFVNLEVNGEPVGVYWEVEGWTKEMIEREHSLSADTDIYSVDFSYIQEDEWSSPLYWKKYIKKPLAEKDVANLEKLLTVVKLEDDRLFNEQIGNILDLDQFYRWQINHMLLDSPHGYGPNLKLYFNKDIGKFQFVSWDAAQLDPAPDNLEQNFNILVSRILNNPDFRLERDKILWDYVGDKDNLKDDLAFIDQQYDLIKGDVYRDKLKVKSNLQFDWEVRTRKSRYEETFKKVKGYLKDNLVLARVGTNLSESNIKASIDLVTDNFSELKLEELELEFDEYIPGQNFFLTDQARSFTSSFVYDETSNEYKLKDLDIALVTDVDTSGSSIEKLSTTKRLLVLSNFEGTNQLVDIDWKVVSKVTGEEAEVDSSYVNEEEFSYFDRINESALTFVNRYPYFRYVDNNKVSLGPGFFNIYQDIISPKDVEVVIQPGTVLNFSQDTSWLSYGPVTANGVDNREIVFTAINPDLGWGNFGIVEADAQFSNCSFSFGSGNRVNGVVMTGMLAVHGGEANISNCSFTEAKDDDGLNVKFGGDSYIANNVFEKNSFDALDLDFTPAVVEYNQFVNNGNDGLDISGSKPVLQHNYLADNGDKCISLGEKTEAVVYDNLAKGCIFGIAVKDESSPEILNNVIVENQVGLASYQKKFFFDGPSTVVKDSIVWFNDDSITLDRESSIKVSGSNIQGGYEGDNIDQEPNFDDNYLTSGKIGLVQEEWLR